MTGNSFDIKIKTEVVSFLKKMELFKENIYKPEDHYTDSVKEISRLKSSSHLQIYNEVMNTFSYDILLMDDSVFLFHKDGKDYRFCFIQNPRVKLSWKDFLQNLNVEEDNLSPAEFTMYRACYDNNEDDSFTLVDYPVFIRYDVSETEYEEGIHPYAHIHIGLHNEMRIPVSKVLTPEMFTAFVVKMVYYQLWKDKKDKTYLVEFYSSVKKGSEAVSLDFFSEVDKQDLYMI